MSSRVTTVRWESLRRAGSSSCSRSHHHQVAGRSRCGTSATRRFWGGAAWKGCGTRGRGRDRGACTGRRRWARWRARTGTGSPRCGAHQGSPPRTGACSHRRPVGRCHPSWRRWERSRSRPPAARREPLRPGTPAQRHLRCCRGGVQEGTRRGTAGGDRGGRMAACSHVNFAAPRATPWHVALTGATAGADAVQAACIIYVYNIHNGSSRTPGKQRGGRGVISSSRDDSYYAYTRATAAGLQSHLVHLQSRSVLHALALRGRKSRSSPNNWLMDIGIAALIADRRPPACSAATRP
jgi:hypothetical protein